MNDDDQETNQQLRWWCHLHAGYTRLPSDTPLLLLYMQTPVAYHNLVDRLLNAA
jgi:hypothetical protein